MNPRHLAERRRKLELDEQNAKVWNPKAKPGYNKEYHLPLQLQEILHEPLYEMQDILKQSRSTMADKVVVGKLLY